MVLYHIGDTLLHSTVSSPQNTRVYLTRYWTFRCLTTVIHLRVVRSVCVLRSRQWILGAEGQSSRRSSFYTSVVYWMMLSVWNQKKCKGKDVEASGFGILSCTILLFAWMNWGDPRKAFMAIACFVAEISPWTSSIRSYSRRDGVDVLYE
jgi:hypothetical protein